jgi:hypothetical protein
VNQDKEIVLVIGLIISSRPNVHHFVEIAMCVATDYQN